MNGVQADWEKHEMDTWEGKGGQQTRLLCVNGRGELFVINQRVYFNCILVASCFLFIHVLFD